MSKLALGVSAFNFTRISVRAFPHRSSLWLTVSKENPEEKPFIENDKSLAEIDEESTFTRIISVVTEYLG